MANSAGNKGPWAASILLPGDVLLPGSPLVSPNGRAELAIEADGKLRLRHDGMSVWEAPTGPKSVARVTVGEGLQPLAARAADGAILWNPSPNQVLAPCLKLSDEGLLALLSTQVTWGNGRHEPGTLLRRIGGLTEGAALPPGESLSAGVYKGTVTEGQFRVSGPGGVIWTTDAKKPIANSYLGVPDDQLIAAPRVYSPGAVVTWAPRKIAPDAIAPTSHQLWLHDDGRLAFYGVRLLWAPLGVRELPAPSVRDIARSSVNRRRLSDGSPAISVIVPMDSDAAGPFDPARPLVLIIVEQRLVSPDVDLDAQLRRLADDMIAEGFDARLFCVGLYSGPLSEDGVIVLALRDFLKAVALSSGTLAGAVLIGAFPQPTIVRRWLWETEYTTPAVIPAAPKGQKYVQCWPEPVANWSDIVLTDFTGNWSDLYAPKARIRAFKGIADGGPGLVDGTTATFAPGKFLDQTIEFDDVFVVQEDSFVLEVQNDGSARAEIDLTRRDPEVFEPLRPQANPIATPDIFVSRINARGAAFSASAIDIDGQGRNWIDANGWPQEVDSGIGPRPIENMSQLVPDPRLEAELLLAYLRRNHRHRASTTTTPDVVAAVSSEDFSQLASAHGIGLRAAVGTSQPSIALDDAGLDDYARFWSLPASVRAVHAHSSSQGSAFTEYVHPLADPPVPIMNAAAAALNARINRPYRWHVDMSTGSPRYLPGADNQNDTADFWLHRGIWLNRLISRGGSFVVHYGCDSPNAVDRDRPYSDPRYDDAQLATCILFYTDALAIFGRTKVFNDSPHAFMRAFDELHVGAGWADLFREKEQDASMTIPSEWVNAKIAYSWVVLGDWTLHRRY